VKKVNNSEFMVWQNDHVNKETCWPCKPNNLNITNKEPGNHEHIPFAPQALLFNSWSPIVTSSFCSRPPLFSLLYICLSQRPSIKQTSDYSATQYLYRWEIQLPFPTGFLMGLFLSTLYADADLRFGTGR
jgi:hypothetical protein